MTQSFLARIFSLFAFLVISASFAVAQNPTPSPAPLQPIVIAPSPTPAPFPFKLSYFGEYIGPRLSHLDFTTTQTPDDKKIQYAYYQHYLKAGFLVAKDVVIGTQLRLINSYDPDPQNGFYWEDARFFISWAHMVETDDVDMTGILKVEVPTTDYTRDTGEIIAFKIENNWILKTSLRNWHFTALTYVKPYFYHDPYNFGKGRESMDIAFLPYVTVDLFPSIQLLFEGYFEALHNYNADFYDYQSGDVDYLDIGPLFTINRHLNTNIAFRFYPDNVSLKEATLYLSVTAVL